MFIFDGGLAGEVIVWTPGRVVTANATLRPQASPASVVWDGRYGYVFTKFLVREYGRTDGPTSIYRFDPERALFERMSAMLPHDADRSQAVGAGDRAVVVLANGKIYEYRPSLDVLAPVPPSPTPAPLNESHEGNRSATPPLVRPPPPPTSPTSVPTVRPTPVAGAIAIPALAAAAAGAGRRG